MVLKPRYERGSAIMEMVLFTPLALFFLFAVIDGGLALLQRAAVTDALRAGLNTELLYNQDGSVLRFDEQSLSPVVNENQALRLLTALASEIAESVKTVQNYGEGETPTTFKVTVAGVVVDIDPRTGALGSTNRVVIGPVYAGDANFDLRTEIPQYDSVSSEDYIENELITERGKLPSSLAIPIGVDYGAAEESVTVRYLDKAVLLYAGVEGTSKTPFNAPTKSLLGTLYGIHEQHLMLLRTQLTS